MSAYPDSLPAEIVKKPWQWRLLPWLFVVTFVVAFAAQLAIVLLSPSAQSADVTSTSTAPKAYPLSLDDLPSGLAACHGLMVEGTALLQPGERVWVFSHRVPGFEQDFWVQSEAFVDPADHRFRTFVTLGEPRDNGFEFEVLAITVGAAEHIRLSTVRTSMAQEGRWTPVALPSGPGHSATLRVVKRC